MRKLIKKREQKVLRQNLKQKRPNPSNRENSGANKDAHEIDKTQRNEILNFFKTANEASD